MKWIIRTKIWHWQRIARSHRKVMMKLLEDHPTDLTLMAVLNHKTLIDVVTQGRYTRAREQFEYAAAKIQKLIKELNSTKK